MTKNILSLTSQEAFDFLMKSEQYHSFELPEYFCFDEVLQFVRDIIDKVYHKLCKQPNSDYNQLWLQNMTYTQDKKSGTSPYTLRLCQLVSGKKNEPLWNNEWLAEELTTGIPYETVVNGETLNKITPVITFRETRLYSEMYLSENFVH